MNRNVTDQSQWDNELHIYGLKDDNDPDSTSPPVPPRKEFFPAIRTIRYDFGELASVRLYKEQPAHVKANPGRACYAIPLENYFQAVVAGNTNDILKEWTPDERRQLASAGVDAIQELLLWVSDDSLQYAFPNATIMNALSDMDRESGHFWTRCDKASRAAKQFLTDHLDVRFPVSTN